MLIKEIVSQHRRDFTAIYKCEYCHSEEKGTGYDDSNFHINVVPNMKCKSCGEKSANGYKPKDTKYPDGLTI